MSFAQHYTVPTVARRLGVSMKTVWRWIKAGKLGPVVQFNGRYFISHAALGRVLGQGAGPESGPAEPIIRARSRGEFIRKARNFFPGEVAPERKR